MNSNPGFHLRQRSSTGNARWRTLYALERSSPATMGVKIKLEIRSLYGLSTGAACNWVLGCSLEVFEAEVERLSRCRGVLIQGQSENLLRRIAEVARSSQLERVDNRRRRSMSRVMISHSVSCRSFTSFTPLGCLPESYHRQPHHSQQTSSLPRP